MGTDCADFDAFLRTAGTRALDANRRDPGGELRRFEATMRRGIPGFETERVVAPRRVLVTGGTGCIGTAVLRVLQRAGSARVVSVSRRPPAGSRTVGGVAYRNCDVRDRVALSRIFARERPELVVHLAAQRDPALAERAVVETISTNVGGTATVLDVAARFGARRVVVASTGKAMRYFTSDVYAATKQLVEYLVARQDGIDASCVRFTHVVDNSLVHDRFLNAIAAGRPPRLHGLDVRFYVQSALASAHLLLLAATTPPARAVLALRDMGEPIRLLDLALDLIARAGSDVPIEISGFEPGYEECAHPGTYSDESGDLSPLFNAIEIDAAMTRTKVGCAADISPAPGRGSIETNAAVHRLIAATTAGAGLQAQRSALADAATELLRWKLRHAGLDRLRAIHRAGAHAERGIADHDFVTDEAAIALRNVDAMAPA